MTQEADIVSACPLCSEALKFTFNTDSIPFFGEIMLVSAQCTCGFRYADTISLNERDAARYELRFGVDDLMTRVIRSSSGTMQIPELGVTVEPGSGSEAFISNVEGVLCRVGEVIHMATKWSAHDPEKFELGNRLLETIDAVKRGEQEMTLILDDPFGNSAIVSSRAQRRTLTTREADRLKTGMITIDISE